MIKSFRFNLRFIWILLLPAALFSNDIGFVQATGNTAVSNPVKLLSSGWQVSVNGSSEYTLTDVPVQFAQDAKSVTLINEFVIPDSLRDLNLTLHFTGIQGFAQISLNKTLVKTHVDFSTPFSVNIQKEWLKQSGKNILEILITKPGQFPQKMPEFAQLFREERFLSIPGPIYIEWLPNVRYSNFTYNYDQVLKIGYNLNIGYNDTLTSGEFNKLRFEEILIAPDGEKIFSRFEYTDFRRQRKTVNREISIKSPQLWSPESPILYTLDLKTYAGGKLVASSSTRIGLRTLAATSKNMIINDHPLALKGITYRLPQPVNQPEADQILSMIRKDLENIKSIGFNAVRIPHATLLPFAFHIADSLGLMLFVENGVWRIPPSFFANEDFLQLAKHITKEIIDIAQPHPSFMAIGLGSEIAVNDPIVQKAMLILDKEIKNSDGILTYCSPLDYRQLPLTHLTDFYMINTYNQATFSALDYFSSHQQLLSAGLVLGNVGFAAGQDSVREQMHKFLLFMDKTENLGGYFIESYRDWYSAIPARGLLNSNRGYGLYPYGLYNQSGEPRDHVDFIKQYFVAGEIPATAFIAKPVVKTNFFSLSIFITSVFFFIFYRQYFHLRDNIKRSLSHSYGFFVDLRDRRIIALFNSFIIGIFSNLLVANIIAAYLYYYRNDLFMEELISAMLVPFGLKGFYISIVQSAFLLLLVIWALFFVGQILIAALMKLFSLFVEEKVRFKQTVAVCNWAGVPLIFLIPVSLVFYQLIMPRADLHIYIIILMIIFFFWYNYRLANGIRVLMILGTIKVFSILVLTYCILFFSFIAFLESRTQFIEYFDMLTQAKSLFY